MGSILLGYFLATAGGDFYSNDNLFDNIIDAKKRVIEYMIINISEMHNKLVEAVKDLPEETQPHGDFSWLKY